MPPKSPLPPRHGLQAAWVRTPDRDTADPTPWPTMRAFLKDKLGPARDAVDGMLERGDFVDESGTPWSGDEPYRPHTFVWFHRELREEPEVPGDIAVLHRDERVVVIDKPHFLSTIPRGRHILQSVVVKARRLLDLPELSAAHRLDRGTAGILLMTTEKRWRAPYHSVFSDPRTTKTYHAIAPLRADLQLPLRVSSHLIKRVGTLQAETLDAPPNAITDMELIDSRPPWGLYRVTPRTGKTHQIRVHFNSLGIPLVGDPLYPAVSDVDVDDFTTPLRLLAHRLQFIDPIDQTARSFTSGMSLRWPDQDQGCASPPLAAVARCLPCES